MKLFYSPGACSLASRIALLEAGLAFDDERVDLRSKRTASGTDYLTVNPKGYVPALVLDNGEVLTENIAVLDWIAAQNPSLGLTGPMGRSRLLEMLAYISTEIHKSYKPLFAGGSEEEKRRAREQVAQRLRYLADRMSSDYLFGKELTVADCYLFVTVLWAENFGIEIPDALIAWRSLMLMRPKVQAAMETEGLSKPHARSA